MNEYEFLEELERAGVEGLFEDAPPAELGFINKLWKKARRRFKKVGKKIGAVVRQVAPLAATIVGGVVGGPSGAASSREVAMALSARPPKRTIMMAQQRVEDLRSVYGPNVNMNTPGMQRIVNDVGYDLAAQRGVNFSSPQSRQAFNRYMTKNTKKWVPWAIGGVGVVAMAVVALMTRGK